MKAKHSKGNVVRTWKKILGLVGVASLTLVCTGVAWSQSQPAQTESTAARPVAAMTSASPGTQPPSAPPATKEVAAQNPPAKPSASKGPSEGIKVHGHWTIEIRNPDGKVVTHREFENSLQQGGYAPLAALVVGNSSSAGLSIGLNMKTAGIDIGGDVAPDGLSYYVGRIDIPYGGPCLDDLGRGIGCLFVTASTTPVSAVSCGGGFICATDLTAPAPTLTAINTYTGNGIQLFGNVTAGTSSTISDVETFLFTCANLISPQTCSNNSAFLTTSKILTGAAMFTERDLDGNTPAGAAAGDPNPVQVTPGQTISVTVTISFQ
ncbi:MAG: hypothetical protein WA817_01495 [Candidatus Acidiferrum sp.]